MTRFWTPFRLRWYPVAVVAAVAIAFAIHVASADDVATLSGRLGGDFPAFYGAGSIVADGDADRLYDLDRQVEAQRSLFPSGHEALPFAYPPHVAAGYRLLVPLGYRGAYIIHTLASLAALWGAIVLAEPMVAVLRGRRLRAMAAALLFLPLAEGALLGQNVAFTLLLIVASWRMVHDGRFLAAGAVVGLLAYKPQFAIPLAGLHLLAGRWRVAVGAASTMAAAYAASAALMGADWVGQWLEQARQFNELDVGLNGDLATSAVGFFANLGAEPVGWALAAVVAATLALLWWRGSRDLTTLMAITAAGLVIMAPHAQQYEPGIMLITLAVFADRGRRWVPLFWLGGTGKVAAGALGWNATAIVVGAAFYLAVQLEPVDAEVTV